MDSVRKYFDDEMSVWSFTYVSETMINTEQVFRQKKFVFQFCFVTMQCNHITSINKIRFLFNSTVHVLQFAHQSRCAGTYAITVT